MRLNRILFPTLEGEEPTHSTMASLKIDVILIGQDVNAGIGGSKKALPNDEMERNTSSHFYSEFRSDDGPLSQNVSHGKSAMICRLAGSVIRPNSIQQLPDCRKLGVTEGEKKSIENDSALHDRTARDLAVPSTGNKIDHGTRPGLTASSTLIFRLR